MAAAVRFVVDGAEVAKLIRSQNGPVGLFMAERATIVQAAAKAQVGVKTGRLKASIVKRWVTNGVDLSIQVGVWTVPYALWHHNGTPPHNIPNAFGWGPSFGIGGRFDGKFHPGTKPNPYLADNLHLAVA